MVHAKKIEKQLKREVKQLLRLAERADAKDIPDGMSIPEQLERRELRIHRYRLLFAQLKVSIRQAARVSE
jgi:hypothetical protein